jgi:2-polyprenyl-6-methoxyphenol hydroxylase-like FAD-dependent oxidoreductase
MAEATPLPFLSGKKILIIGGGISGLSFAASLYKLLPSISSPTFIPPTLKIYERDTSDLDPTRQGYTLSIRSDSNTGGVQTLQNLGLLDKAFAESVNASQAGMGDEKRGTFCLWDAKWSEIFRVEMQAPKGAPVQSLRIKRNVLRKILVNAVVERGVKIEWEKKVVGVEKLAGGRLKVLFERGEAEECDFLVAADGSKSRVRGALKPGDGLVFQEVVGIMGESRFVGKPPGPANKDWGMMLSGTGNGLFVSPVDEHSVVWSISYHAREPRKLSELSIGEPDADELLKEVLERGKEIAEPFRTYVEATDLETLMVRNFSDKPPFEHGTGSLKETNVVFLGDANHAVTPFAGSGACLALSDGWDMAEQLAKHEKLEDALKAYDQSSIPRAKGVLRFSHFIMKFGHGNGWWTWVLVIGFKIMFGVMMLLRKFH